MILEQPERSPYAPLEPDEVRWHATPADSAALALVVQDAMTAENHLTSQRWLAEWDRAQLLFEAPAEVRFWEGTSMPRAHVSVPLLLIHIESILPQVIGGLFGDDPPFQFQPNPGTSGDAARAAAALIGYELRKIGFREEVRKGVKSALQFGTGIWKWGWEEHSTKRRIYRRAAQPLRVKLPGQPDLVAETAQSERLEAEVIEEQVALPTFEWVDIREVLVDPGLRAPDIRQAKYVIHRMYVTANELDSLRGFEGYDIPDRATLKAIFFPPVEPTETSPLDSPPVLLPEQEFSPLPRWAESTADPMEHPIEVLERWDGERVITVLNRKVVIRNEENEFGRIPFLSLPYVDVLRSFWSLGCARLIGGEQRLQQGLINARLDEVAINLNGMFVRQAGSNIASQNIRMRPGGVLVEDKPDSLRVLPRLNAVPEAYVEVQASAARAEQATGANELIVQGSLPSSGRSSITRTATGVQALTGGSGARLQYLIENLADQVFIPFLLACHEMNAAKMPLTQIRRVLDQELQQAFEGDVLDILNARLEFSVLAGAKMQARRAMAQSLPLIAQMVLSEPVAGMLTQQGKKIDINEFVNMIYDVAGWKNKSSLIKDMSDEDEQRSAMQNPAVQQMLVNRQKNAQQAGSKSQMIDQENMGRAGRRVLETILRKVEEPELQSGDMGSGQGFGANAG